VTSGEAAVVDFPFDLNNLFSLQYSFDQLKMAIEYLARQQGNQQVLINELLSREPSSGEVRIVEKVIERVETQVIREAPKVTATEPSKVAATEPPKVAVSEAAKPDHTRAKSP